VIGQYIVPTVIAYFKSQKYIALEETSPQSVTSSIRNNRSPDFVGGKTVLQWICCNYLIFCMQTILKRVCFKFLACLSIYNSFLVIHCTRTLLCIYSTSFMLFTFPYSSLPLTTNVSIFLIPVWRKTTSKFVRDPRKSLKSFQFDNFKTLCMKRFDENAW